MHYFGRNVSTPRVFSYTHYRLYISSFILYTVKSFLFYFPFHPCQAYLDLPDNLRGHTATLGMSPMGTPIFHLGKPLGSGTNTGYPRVIFHQWPWAPPPLGAAYLMDWDPYECLSGSSLGLLCGLAVWMWVDPESCNAYTFRGQDRKWWNGGVQQNCQGLLDIYTQEAYKRVESRVNKLKCLIKITYLFSVLSLFKTFVDYQNHRAQQSMKLLRHTLADGMTVVRLFTLSSIYWQLGNQE